MTTIAWLFIICAVVMIRQVTKGRADKLPEDLRDFMLALLSGDNAAMKEVASRTGDTLTPSEAVTPTGTGTGNGVVGGNASDNGVALLTEARKLGAAAGNRYVWGATGPNGYDCSGLVWRAARNIGVYKGVRFTTYTFRVQSKGWAQEVKSPAVGDIVLWTGHMGIVSGPDKMYNALSRNSGILESSISKHSGTPSYWRVQ